MAALSEFPSASAKDTVAFCWQQVAGNKRQLVTAWVVMALAVIVADVVCPLIFASILERVAGLPDHPGATEWSTFGPLLLAYGVAGLVAMAGWRVAGWLEWGACLRSFATGINNGYAHLLELSYRWHMDHPAGEVISSLGNFSWAFAEMVDVASWGLLPVAVVVLSAIGVLAVVAWPAALALLAMVTGFVLGDRAPAAPGPGGVPGLRGPPLEGHRGGGRHRDQPDGGAHRGHRGARAVPGGRAHATSRSPPTSGPAPSSCAPSWSWRRPSWSAPCWPWWPGPPWPCTTGPRPPRST